MCAPPAAASVGSSAGWPAGSGGGQMGTAVVEVRGLRKRYGERTVVVDEAYEFA